MGITNKLLAKVKAWFEDEKQQVIVKEAKGMSVDADAGIETGSNSQELGQVTGMMALDHALMLRYADYEQMDDYPELSKVLDVYADDSTIPDSIHGKTIWARSDNRNVREIIDDLLHRILRIEEDIWLLSRTLCKYGNCFAENILSPKGVLGYNFLPTPTMRRIVDKNGGLVGFVQSKRGISGVDIGVVDSIEKAMAKNKDNDDLVFFKPWEIVHWRLRTKHLRSLYGYSVYDASRWIWKRLRLLEDTSLVYKLTRSPSRFAFYIDVGDIPPKKAMALVKKVRSRYRKKTLINSDTNKLDFRYDAISPDEDIFVPTKGGKESTRIDTVNGLDWNVIDDLEYYRGKLVGTAGVPRGYLEDDGSDSRASLAQKDVRFARSVMRVQREIRNGIKKTVRVHLALLGIDPDNHVHELVMTVPSSIFEMQQIEVMTAQADLADKLASYFPKEWILKRVLHLSEDEAILAVDSRLAEMDKEEKSQARVQSEIQNMYPDIKDEDYKDKAPVTEDVDKKYLHIQGQITKTIQNTNEMIKSINRMEEKLIDKRHLKKMFKER